MNFLPLVQSPHAFLLYLLSLANLIGSEILVTTYFVLCYHIANNSISIPRWNLQVIRHSSNFSVKLFEKLTSVKIKDVFMHYSTK